MTLTLGIDDVRRVEAAPETDLDDVGVGAGTPGRPRIRRPS